MKIGDAELDLRVDDKDFNRGLNSAAQKAEEFKNKVVPALTVVGVAMAALGTAVVGMAMASIKSYADLGSMIHDLALRTGFSTEMLSELKYMAGQCGASIEGLEVGIKRLQSAIFDAGRGSQMAIDDLAALGLTFEDLQGLRPEDQFWKIAYALAQIPDAFTRAALAQNLFGRSGTDILPILAEGTAGIDAMKERARELGIVFSQEAANKADELGDKLQNLKDAGMGLQIAIAEAITPTVQKFADDVTKVVTAVQGWIDVHPVLTEWIIKLAGLIGIGGILLIAVGQIINAFKALAIAIAFVQAMMGPTGWANLGIGLAAAAGAAVLISAGIATAQSMQETPSMGVGGRVPGALGAPVPIMAHGGEEFLGIGSTRGSSGGITVQIMGDFMGDDSSIRALERRLIGIRREEERRYRFMPSRTEFYSPGHHL